MSTSTGLLTELRGSYSGKALRRKYGFCPGLLVALALLLALLSCQAGFSITTQELIAKIEAKSKRFDAKVRDITIEVEATARGEGGEDIALGESRIWKRGEKFRIEGSFRAPGMDKKLTSTVISDGEALWTVIPSVGKMKIPQTGGASSQYADWSRLIPEDAEILGREKVERRSAYKIAFSDTLMKYLLWLDTERLVPLKVTTEPIQEDFPVTTILYKSYEKVEGLWGLPHLWETYMGEDLFTTTRVKSVEVNSNLSDALFDASEVEEEEVDPQELMRRLMER